MIDLQPAIFTNQTVDPFQGLLTRVISTFNRDFEIVSRDLVLDQNVDLAFRSISAFLEERCWLPGIYPK